VIFVLIIAFSAITIFQNVGKSLKVDITEQKLYTLSDGTKSILGKLQQPLRMKLYYAETAALKGPDQIRFYNNYYRFVRTLLEEYTLASGGMVELEVIDPRPFTDDEADALRYGLQKFTITQEESFFFGLVLQTQFGVEKSIPFFSPDRENFIEYDISSLIDTAVTRQKRKIGVLSSLEVMGDSPYMAYMKQQQRQPVATEWGIVAQLKQKFDVEAVAADVEEIAGVDILLVIHPKSLPEKTLFAIDQFVLKGGRAIVCIDPYAVADKSGQAAMQSGQMPVMSSNLDPLLGKWGLEMASNTFAGDRLLAQIGAMGPNQRPEKMLWVMNLSGQCFNREAVATANLNDVRMVYPGALRQVFDAAGEEEGDDQSDKTEYRPLIMTTEQGNTWSVGSVFELMQPNPSAVMKKFSDGSEPVVMGYLVKGRFESAFPNGIEIEDPAEVGEDQQPTEPVIRKVTGLTEAAEECVVAVFADVDFISDIPGIAFQASFFGKVAINDNPALLMNMLEDLSGSSDLISIRSRGNFKRPFTVVDEIKAIAEAETAAEVDKINADIEGFRAELSEIVANAKQGEQAIIGSAIQKKKQELEYKIRKAEVEKNKIQLKRRESIDKLGAKLQNINMLLAPVIILLVSIVISIRRNVRKRHYISHASDA
jgi:ABC-type uncharacterized transport system involved in gliding motility auxiliary subunit